MKTCKFCGELCEPYEIGYCEKCFKKIKADVKTFKASLSALRDEAFGASEERRSEILQETRQIESQIDFYLKKKVPVPVKSIRPLIQEIYASCGVRQISSKSQVFRRLHTVFTGLLAVICIVMGVGFYQLNGYVDSLIVSVQGKDTQIVDLQTQISDLQSQLDEATAPPSQKTYTFENGNYVAGKDFVAGVYDISGVSGKGSVVSDNYENMIALMMRGNNESDDLDIYEKSYSNAYLPEGTTLTVDGVKIRLTLVEEY